MDLILSRIKNSTGKEVPQAEDRELYLEHVADTRKMIDAAAVGFVDHRFEHAIITIQRLLGTERRALRPLFPTRSNGDNGI